MMKGAGIVYYDGREQRLRTRDWGLLVDIKLIKYRSEITGIFLATLEINR